MDKSEIPKNDLEEIRRRARAQWADDEEMAAFVIDQETEHYLKFYAFKFGRAQNVKAKLIEHAYKTHDDWECRYRTVKDETAAYIKLLNLKFEGVPEEHVKGSLAAAETIEPDSYVKQFEFVKRAAAFYLYAHKVRKKVGPMAELLIRMERIIGDETYNNYIQNYGPFGVWESQGRSFRYPVRFLNQGQEEQWRAVPADMKPEVLITGWYKFGANQLGIYRALVQIVEMLQRDYGLQLPKRE